MQSLIKEGYEEQLLSCLLQDNRLIDSLVLKPNDFGVAKYRKYLKAMVNLNNNDKEINTVTFHDEAKITLTEAQILHDACPSSQVFESLQEILVDLAAKRRLQDVINKAKVALNEGKKLEEIENILFSEEGVIDKDMDKGVLAPDMMYEVLSDLDEKKLLGGGITGMKTGLPKLDFMLNGIEKGRYIVVAARTSVGKTALAIEIARRLSQKHMVAYFSIEMPVLDLGQRLLSSQGQVKLNNIRKGKLKDETVERLSNVSNELSSNKLLINDDEEMTIEKLVKLTRKYKRLYGIEGIFVDYITLLGTEKRFNNKIDQVEYISQRLRKLSKSLNIAVIAVAQLNRNLEYRTVKTPMLADIKECGCIEQDANVVLLLYGEEEENMDEYEVSILNVKIAKNRGGGTTDKPIVMKYYKKTQRIEE